MNKENLITALINSRIYQIPFKINKDFQIDSIKDAYLIQDIINKKLNKLGYGKIKGYKIGCTNEIIQKELSIDHPILGVCFENKIIQNNSNLCLKNYIKPGIECEIYVVIKEDITSEIFNDDINFDKFISYYGVSLEIVENRFKEFKYTNAELIIADGSLGNSIIFGNKVKNNSFVNLNELNGRIIINNKEIYCNNASSILGNPENALKWFFNQMIELKKVIKKGSYVSLGSITPLIWIKEPTKVKVSIDNIGDCVINFVK